MIGSDRWPIWLGYLNYSLPTHSESHKEPLTGDLLSQEIPPVSYFYSSWLTWCRLPAPASCHPCPVSSDEASNSTGIFDSQTNSLGSLWLHYSPLFVWERSLRSFKKTWLEDIQLRRKSIKHSLAAISVIPLRVSRAVASTDMSSTSGSTIS